MKGGAISPSSNSTGPRVLALALTLMFLGTMLVPLVGAATTMIFVSPVPSETVKGMVDVEVKMDINPVSVSLFVDGVYFSDMTYTGYDFTYWHFRYSIDTWGLYDGSHMMRVEANNSGLSTSKGIVFFVDNFAPAISELEVKFPKDQTAAKKGDTLTLTARISESVSGIKEVLCDASKLQSQNSIQMFDDGQHNDSVEGDSIYGTDPFKVFALTNGYNLAYVSAEDNMGNVAMTPVPVAMDNTPPALDEAFVDYPPGQDALKLGDDTHMVAKVEDRGEGGFLRVGTDIVLVLDNSGSMINGADPAMDDLKEAVKNFVNMSHPEDRIALYSFDTNDFYPYLYEDARRYIDFTSMDGKGKQDIIDFLDYDWDFNTAHNTPIWDTIGNAIKYASTDAEHQPVVVAITDGTDYGYDWYERPDPSWWQDAYNWGFTGLGFERGSEEYAPWNDWGTTIRYTTHYGEYPAPWPDDDEVHFFDAPINDENTFNYSGAPNDEEDRDYSSGLRMGLLHSKVPVFTIGLGISHHIPIMKNTTEYDLYQIARTSSNETLRGKYYYAPEPNDLAQIYGDISFFINLAGDINITPPGGLKKFSLDASPLGQIVSKALIDDGEHDDIFVDDEVFGTVDFAVKTDVTQVINVTLDAVDIAGHKIKYDVEVLVDNTDPTIEDLRPNIIDIDNMTLLPNKSYASDGDYVFFCVNASDQGEVRGVSKVLLDGTPLGGDKGLLMSDDGKGWDETAGDHVYTSKSFAMTTGESDDFIDVKATAFDIANNTASVTGDLLVLNNLDIVGQLVDPLNDSYISGEVMVKLAISDDTNVDDVYLAIEPVAPLDQFEMPIEVIMAKDQVTGLYMAFWNTTQYPDYLYNLSARIMTRAKTTILTKNITVTVDNTPPEVEIKAPKDLSLINTTVLLQVDAKDDKGAPYFIFHDLLASATYSIDDGPYKVLPSSIDGTYPFETYIDPFSMADGEHILVVRVVDMGAWEAYDNITFFVDTMSPIVTPVYIPPVDQNITGTFKFGFEAQDTTGVAVSLLLIDGNKGDTYNFIIDPETGLFEFDLDTTRLEDGNHTYCAVFKDEVGLLSQYCDTFKVNNSELPKPPPKRNTALVEMPWWIWLIVSLMVAVSLISTVFVARERRRIQRMEIEILERAAREEKASQREDEAVELPPKLPSMGPKDGPESRTKTKRPPSMVPMDIENGKKGDRKVGRYEISAIAPALITRSKFERAEDEDLGKDNKIHEGAKLEPQGRKDSPSMKRRKFVRCPICKSKISVKSSKRPLVIECDYCGARGKLN